MARSATWCTAAHPGRSLHAGPQDAAQHTLAGNGKNFFLCRLNVQRAIVQIGKKIEIEHLAQFAHTPPRLGVQRAGECKAK